MGIGVRGDGAAIGGVLPRSCHQSGLSAVLLFQPQFPGREAAPEGVAVEESVGICLARQPELDAGLEGAFPHRIPPVRQQGKGRSAFPVGHGALAEVASGQSFGDYLKTHIFDPLGMDATGFALTDAVRSRMMTQYRRDPDTGTVSAMPAENPYILSPKYESGGAGLISTVDDYVKFAAALTNGGQAADGTRILSSAAVNLMRTNRLDEVRLKDFNWPQLAGYGYGLGVRTLIAPTRGGSLSPVGEFGWDGAAGCYVLTDPENRLTLFYAQQMLPSMCEYTHPRLRNLLYGCL